MTDRYDPSEQARQRRGQDTRQGRGEDSLMRSHKEARLAKNGAEQGEEGGPEQRQTDMHPAEVAPDPGAALVQRQEVDLSPTVLDSQGIHYNTRPDRVLVQYVERAGLDEEELASFHHLLALRKWVEVRQLLVSLYRKKEGVEAQADNCIRIEKAVTKLDSMGVIKSHA